jgi:hypothetical protein
VSLTDDVKAFDHRLRQAARVREVRELLNAALKRLRGTDD